MSYIPFILLLAHYLGDFELQTHKMSTLKSKSVKWLGIHCITYTVFLAIATLNPMFALFNGLAHFGVDFITSKRTSKLWGEERWHRFFCVVGLDQFIHLTILFYSYTLFTA